MMLNMLRAVWKYRGFILGSIKREFQSKYQDSLLGAAWAIINPLAMIIVYTVIFSRVMQAKLPGVTTTFGYSIYLCAGVLTWGLFIEIVTRSQVVFLEHANLLKKINFPRLCLPLIVVGNAGVNFSIVFGLFTIFLLITGNFPGEPYIAVIPILLIEMLFAIGLGILVGVLNVFFRDVGQFFSIFLQFWFWFTPIVYPLSIIPDSVRNFMYLNPIGPLIGAYQRIFVNQNWPQWDTLVPVAIGSLLLAGFTMSLFRRRAGEMVDEL